MPFNGTTKLFDRIWAFVDQFSSDEAVRRSDMDIAFNDVTAGLNDTNAYLKGLIDTLAADGVLFLGLNDGAPATNLSGGELVAGNAYVDLNDLFLYIYDGSLWQAVGGGGNYNEFIDSLLAAADAPEFRALLELGTAATLNQAALMVASNNLSDVPNKELALTNLGGTNIGRALFRTANAAAARTTIGAQIAGNYALATQLAEYRRVDQSFVSLEAANIAANTIYQAPNRPTIIMVRGSAAAGGVAMTARIGDTGAVASRVVSATTIQANGGEGFCFAVPANWFYYIETSSTFSVLTTHRLY
ncbi:MAG: hypothetical protein AAGD43_21410 [Pseudomonadota bacterium]